MIKNPEFSLCTEREKEIIISPPKMDIDSFMEKTITYRKTKIIASFKL